MLSEINSSARIEDALENFDDLKFTSARLHRDGNVVGL